MVKTFRKQCVYSVLATDLTKHFDTIAHIKTVKMVTSAELEYVFKAVLKMADLSHVAKPLPQHKQWSMLITQEFHSQGDQEVQHGLDISPLCNRQNTKLAKGQVGFIKHVVQPLYSAAQRFFDKESRFETAIMAQLSVNRKYWESEAKKEESVSLTLRTASNDEEMKATPKAASTSKSKSKSNTNMAMKPRPMSATFSHQHRTRSKFAILTNLDGTPPPMLPSSVRGMESMSTRAAHRFNSRMTTFFPPSNSNNRNNNNNNSVASGAAVVATSATANRLKLPHVSDSAVVDKSSVFMLPARPLNTFKRVRSSSANSLELVPATAKTLQSPPLPLPLPLYDAGDEKSHSQSCLDGKLKRPALAMLLSPRVIGEDPNLSPRSLLKLGGATPISARTIRNNTRLQSSDDRYMSLTPKFTKSKTQTTKFHPVNRMAFSPKVQQPQLKNRNSRENLKSARNIMRTKSSDGAPTMIIDAHVGKVDKHSQSVSILHALSPPARNSPFSCSHQKQVHDYKQEPSPDDRPRQFKFDIIDEQK